MTKRYENWVERLFDLIKLGKLYIIRIDEKTGGEDQIKLNYLGDDMISTNEI